MSTTDAFEKVTFRGRLMDRKTQAFLEVMEAELGYELTVVQGSYTSANPASAGTHDGGGVVDLAAYDQARKVHVARQLGAFAWYRPDLPGVWGEHIHLGIRDHGRLSSDARDQQVDYDARPARNGLAGHAPDNTWHPAPPVTFQYPPKETPVAPVPTKVTTCLDALQQAIASLGDAAAALDDADPGRVVARAQRDDIRAARRTVRAIFETLPPR